MQPSLYNMNNVAAYIHRFSHLHTATSCTHWTSATCYKAPNKPLLLLTIIDLFAQGSIINNLIEPTEELGDLFSRYWSHVMQPDRRGNLAMPFFHLRSEGFWHLYPRPGQETALAAISTMTSMNQLRNILLGARLDDELYELLCTEAGQAQLRTALIETYFAPELRPRLIEQSNTNLEAYFYSKRLLELARHSPLQIGEHADTYETQPPVRDQGFRRAIVQSYDHRCAFCGIRMLTAEGHTAVTAAHIIPWSVSYNDDPRNGMALCRLCHWTFDEGMLSVSSHYLVIASPQLRISENVPGHLATLVDRPILGPEEQHLWPSKDTIAWHRRHILLRR
jgi:putative restriction endonuclease